MPTFKLQTTLEWVLILSAVIIIFTLFFYAYIKSLNIGSSTQSLFITTMQTGGFGSGVSSCSFNFTFQASQNSFSNFPILLQMRNYTGTTMNASINSTYYTITTYPLSNNYYFYMYNTTSKPFPAQICDLFTSYPTSTTGSIAGIFVLINGKEKLFVFSPQIPAVKII